MTSTAGVALVQQEIQSPSLMQYIYMETNFQDPSKFAAAAAAAAPAAAEAPKEEPKVEEEEEESDEDFGMGLFD